MEENEEREARKKLAEIFEGMGGEITGWLLREGYFPELAFMVTDHELRLGRQKLTTPIKLYEEKFGDKRFGLILGKAILDGFINFNSEVVKELFEYCKEEHEKAKSPLQAIEEVDIFDRIWKYHKEGNRHGVLRCLWDALKQEDTEAIAEAAKAGEALGIPKGVTKVIIRLFVKEWTEQKNHKVLIDIAFSSELLEYVKEYLNPEFVKTREGHRN